jgi:hypothetical protein
MSAERITLRITQRAALYTLRDPCGPKDERGRPLALLWKVV